MTLVWPCQMRVRGEQASSCYCSKLIFNWVYQHHRIIVVTRNYMYNQYRMPKLMKMECYSKRMEYGDLQIYMNKPNSYII